MTDIYLHFLCAHYRLSGNALLTTALQVRAAVDAVLLDDTTGAVSGVRLRKTEPMSGRQLEVLCPCVVSTAGVINTLTKLLRPDVLPTCMYCLDYSTLRIRVLFE